MYVEVSIQSGHFIVRLNLSVHSNATRHYLDYLDAFQSLKLPFVVVLKSYGVLTGYLLADDPQGETPMIPSEVMEYSIKHSTEVDINTTLQLLGSPGEKATSIPGCNRTDSVIR